MGRTIATLRKMYITLDAKDIPKLHFWKLTGEDCNYEIEFDDYGPWRDQFRHSKQPYLCTEAISELKMLLRDIDGTGCMIIDDDYEGISVLRHDMQSTPEISVVIIDSSNITDISLYRL
jgi:hypothetical protein